MDPRYGAQQTTDNSATALTYTPANAVSRPPAVRRAPPPTVAAAAASGCKPFSSINDDASVDQSATRISMQGQRLPNTSSQPLWQFLLELLNEKRCSGIIAWTGKGTEFELKDQDALAKEWGIRKKKPNMNYDKLSRALRYYYTKNIIEKVPGRRYVYRFIMPNLPKGSADYRFPSSGYNGSPSPSFSSCSSTSPMGSATASPTQPQPAPLPMGGFIYPPNPCPSTSQHQQPHLYQPNYQQPTPPPPPPTLPPSHYQEPDLAPTIQSSSFFRTTRTSSYDDAAAVAALHPPPPVITQPLSYPTTSTTAPTPLTTTATACAYGSGYGGGGVPPLVREDFDFSDLPLALPEFGLDYQSAEYPSERSSSSSGVSCQPPYNYYTH